MAGDILSFRAFGQVIVVLNSVKATKDLFERRGNIYSDRPVIPIHEMMKWQWLIGLARYTDYWRQARKLLDRGLRPGVIAVYRPLQQANARVLLTRLLANPKELEAHVTHMLGVLTLGIGYGYEVQDPSDQNIYVARKLAQLAAATHLPGALLVNYLPFLRYIPEWVPWLSYKPLARYGYNLGKDVQHGLMAFVRESIPSGTARPSLAVKGLQEIENLKGREREKAEEVIAGALGSMYAAAAGTTVTSVMSFVAGVLLCPDIQIRAQRELDEVTRRERLPTFEDRSALPFVDAICKEALRWRPALPLALPHATTEDDVYEGFLIPKGALVVGNAWAILHDSVTYPEPDSFKPERFLKADGSLRDDPVLVSVFGFGKRICPGRHFVDGTLFIVVATLLSVLKIGEENGHDEGPNVFSCGAVNRLTRRPIRFSITPRDKQAEELIVADALTR
ncbi:cytochrome P450 [Russula dissimulans]|nr:cytochrome P450 [Russula dissimulans]